MPRGPPVRSAPQMLATPDAAMDGAQDLRDVFREGYERVRVHPSSCSGAEVPGMPRGPPVRS